MRLKSSDGRPESVTIGAHGKFNEFTWDSDCLCFVSGTFKGIMTMSQWLSQA